MKVAQDEKIDEPLLLHPLPSKIQFVNLNSFRIFLHSTFRFLKYKKKLILK